MSRRERKKQDVNKNRKSGSSDISKAYYIVIGLLFVILIGLVIFIFSRTGDNVDLNNGNENNDTTEQVETPDPDDETTDVDEPSTEDATETESPDASDGETTDEPEDEQTNESEEESEETAEEPENIEDTETSDAGNTDVGETVTVNNDAPHDPTHAVDYAGGSADRAAIKNRVMEVTGLDSSLIEWWIGNDGPGRVKATVSNSDSTIYYDVYLQYGDGGWHVTRYQRVSRN